MPAFVIALLIALAAMGGGAAVQSALPPDTRAELAVIAAGIVGSDDLTVSPAREAPGRTGLSSGRPAARLALDEPVTGTLPVTGTVPISDTTPLPVTVPVTPSVPLTDTIGQPDSRHRNPITGTIQVTLTQTISDVLKLADDPSMTGEAWRGLLAKLNAARASLERGNAGAAGGQIDAFLHELDAFRQSGRISADEYAALYLQYQSLVTSLGERALPEAAPKAEHGKGQPVTAPETQADPAGSADRDDGRDRGRGGRQAEVESAPAPRPAPGPDRVAAPPAANADKDNQGKNDGKAGSASPGNAKGRR